MAYIVSRRSGWNSLRGYCVIFRSAKGLKIPEGLFEQGLIALLEFEPLVCRSVLVARKHILYTSFRSCMRASPGGPFPRAHITSLYRYASRLLSLYPFTFAEYKGSSGFFSFIGLRYSLKITRGCVLSNFPLTVGRQSWLRHPLGSKKMTSIRW